TPDDLTAALTAPPAEEAAPEPATPPTDEAVTFAPPQTPAADVPTEEPPAPAEPADPAADSPSPDEEYDLPAEDKVPLPPASSRVASPPPRGETRSFYSRRSARLPRIGEDAGRNALASLSAMRKHHDDEDEDEADAAPVEDTDGE
ncbi:MAG: hypothetical protein PVI35_02965, partial [Acidimicrobiia bacterium]